MDQQKLFEKADWLNVMNNRGYGRLPLNVPRDAEISHLLRTWIAMDSTNRQAAALKLAEEQRFTLLAYSERMASQAVRDRNSDLIFLGLIALGIDGWLGDWRDNATVICLHCDAAERIGASASELFDKAAELLSEKAGKAIRSFLARSDAKRSIAVMGYTTGSDEGGFRYIRTW